jgi:hypothetical protein
MSLHQFAMLLPPPLSNAIAEASSTHLQTLHLSSATAPDLMEELLKQEAMSPLELTANARA